MTDPKRWLYDSASSELERAVLSSGLEAEPPPGAEQEIWAALAGRLPPDAGVPGADSSGIGTDAGGMLPAAGSAPALAGAVSGVTLGIIAGLGAALTYVAIESSQTQVEVSSQAPMVSAVATVASGVAGRDSNAGSAPVPPRRDEAPAADVGSARSAPSRARSSRPEAHPQPLATAEQKSGEVAAPQAAEAAAAAAIPDPPAVAPASPELDRTSRLREEAALLRSARNALRAGNALQSLATLEESRRRFPRPVLGQEREALTIEALWTSGARSDARARARAFLQANPRSPHGATLRPFAD